jgi:hypothetical protein
MGWEGDIAVSPSLIANTQHPGEMKMDADEFEQIINKKLLRFALMRRPADHPNQIELSQITKLNAAQSMNRIYTQISRIL